jgi:hypothetical protein
MNPAILTALLVERLLGWRVTSDRFLLGARQWKPRHYFQPLKRSGDAFRLLQAACPNWYAITRAERGLCTVKIQIEGRVGEACAASEAQAISYAVARAIGIQLEAHD